MPRSPVIAAAAQGATAGQSTVTNYYADDITALPEVKKELLTFTVIGGGFSGVETAGEMMELIERSLAFYPNIDRREVRVLLVEFADRLLGELPDSLGEYTRNFFEKRGIEVRLRTGIREATGTAIVTTDGELIGNYRLYDDEAVYLFRAVKDSGLELTVTRKHPLGVTPVVRYLDTEDLDLFAAPGLDLEDGARALEAAAAACRATLKRLRVYPDFRRVLATRGDEAVEHAAPAPE